jgi:DnaK suppressor protein
MTATPTVFTPDQIFQLREELQRTLSRLERSIKTNGNGHPREIDQSAVGRLSRIEAIQNQGMTQGLHERDRVQLGEILAALDRLEEGGYGICATCQHPIRFERLLVFPEARTCACCGAN